MAAGVASYISVNKFVELDWIYPAAGDAAISIQWRCFEQRLGVGKQRGQHHHAGISMYLLAERTIPAFPAAIAWLYHHFQRRRIIHRMTKTARALVGSNAPFAPLKMETQGLMMEDGG